jgi:hypothetical protein
MNPHLAHMRAYPFERLRDLLAGITPPPGLTHIRCRSANRAIGRRSSSARR